MSRDPHAELRSRIIRKLRSAEWMERHFGISAHAEDVADAVMELFPEVQVEREFRTHGVGVRWSEQDPRIRFVLRTAPEPITDGGTP